VCLLRGTDQAFILTESVSGQYLRDMKVETCHLYDELSEDFDQPQPLKSKRSSRSSASSLDNPVVL
jgi:hypothetical protein